MSIGTQNLDAARLQHAPKLPRRKLGFPPGEPFAEGDEDVLEDGIVVITLRNVDQQYPTPFENTHVLIEELARIPKVFQQSLVENDVEGLVAKREAQRITAGDGHARPK